LKSRLQIQNIAASLLQLLCRLKDRRVALRDLKPDNLFLDADPNHFPVVLKNPAAFSMGVIDVETAVSLIPLQDGTIAQPVLGGTPLYATPLHLLENTTISAYFGSVADVLHLQDWHATTAILFKVMTGRNLFQRAARSFPEVLKILKSGRFKSSPGEAIVQAMSQHFWSAAAADIQSHLSAYSDVLNQLALAVPAALIPSIGTELAREKACLQRAIGQHVILCPLFRSEKNRRFLAEASSETIVQQIARWENGERVKAHHRPMAPKMVAFLKNLHRLKQGLSEKNKAIAALAIPPHEVSAFALIEAMFQVVFRSFYRTRWGAGVASSGASDQQLAVEENRLLVTSLLSDP
jgi:serine/threonine protein kinase